MSDKVVKLLDDAENATILPDGHCTFTPNKSNKNASTSRLSTAFGKRSTPMTNDAKESDGPDEEKEVEMDAEEELFIKIMMKEMEGIKKRMLVILAKSEKLRLQLLNLQKVVKESLVPAINKLSVEKIDYGEQEIGL